MRERTRLRTLAFLLAAVVVSPPLLAGCAAFASRSVPVAQAPHRVPPRALAIAQVRADDATRFELCPVEACPRPTPKTLERRTQASVPALPLSDAPLALPPSSSAAPTAQLASASAAPVPQVTETRPAVPAPSRTTVVTFAPGAAVLTATAMQALAAILPDARRAQVIEIRGRTDELGSAAWNDVLARNRALAVRDYLRAYDLPEATTVRLSARGACCYVAGNDTAQGRAANRRVEIEWQPGVQIAQRTNHEQH
jgi:outer membrane protein OmpA-like peptidoglycan-associated protein